MLNLIIPLRPSRGFPLYRTLFLLSGIAGAWPSVLAAQGSLARRIERLLDRRPWNRATWGVLVVSQRGQTVFERNADRLFVPASTAKLAVTAAAGEDRAPNPGPLGALPDVGRPDVRLVGRGVGVEGLHRGDDVELAEPVVILRVQNLHVLTPVP